MANKNNSENENKLKSEVEIESHIYFMISGKCMCGNSLVLTDKDILNECYTFECLLCKTKNIMYISQE